MTVLVSVMSQRLREVVQVPACTRTVMCCCRNSCLYGNNTPVGTTVWHFHMPTMSLGHHMVVWASLFPHLLCPSATMWRNSFRFVHLQYFTSTGCVVGKLVHLPVPAPTCGITGRPICVSALCQAQCHSGAAHLFTTCSISQCHTGWCCFTCSQAYGVAASGSMNTLVHTYAVSNCCQVAVWALTPHGSLGVLVSATVCLSDSMWQQGHTLWRLLYARITM